MRLVLAEFYQSPKRLSNAWPIFEEAINLYPGDQYYIKNIFEKHLKFDVIRITFYHFNLGYPVLVLPGLTAHMSILKKGIIIRILIMAGQFVKILENAFQVNKYFTENEECEKTKKDFCNNNGKCFVVIFILKDTWVEEEILQLF